VSPAGRIDCCGGLGEPTERKPVAALGGSGGGRAAPANQIEMISAAPVGARVDHRTFIPIQVESSAVAATQDIAIELRRGATVVKVSWPLAAAADCAVWLRELLR